MSTIAFDGHELVGDRCSWTGNMKCRVRKVFRALDASGKPVLVGIVGDGAWGTAWFQWKFCKGEHPGPHPHKDLQRPNVIAMVVDSRRRVWEHNSNLQAMQRLGRLHAMGAGQEMALGAMAAGASARKAVRICIKHSDVAGIGIDVVKL